MSILYVKKDDIHLDMKQGYGQAELLPGTYPGGVHAWRCKLNAGCQVKPEMQKDTIQVFCLTDGKGAIITPERAYSIDEVSFYVADPDSTFCIHAATDMTWTMFVVEQKLGDLERYRAFHMKLPFFKGLSQCVEYCQDCKSPSSRSYSVIPTKRLCRILMGVGEASAEHSDQPEGCFEKGHPAVAQWNVPFGDTEMLLTVDGESVDQESGDFSYVPAGLDHSLQCKPGKNIHYIWFEHYVLEKDYLVSYPRS
mgnify:CR=1 FL=1